MLYSVIDPTGSKLDIVQLRAAKSEKEAGRSTIVGLAMQVGKNF